MPEFADTLGLQPLSWDGAGCGCGVYIAPDDEYPKYFYGLYPFWDAPQNLESPSPAATIVPFDRLTRIGYYGVTFDD